MIFPSPDFTASNMEDLVHQLVRKPEIAIRHHLLQPLHKLIWSETETTQGKRNGWWVAWRRYSSAIDDAWDLVDNNSLTGALQGYLKPIEEMRPSLVEAARASEDHSDKTRTLAWLFRYALVEASITSLSVAAPIDMIETLYEAEVWTAAQCLVFAKRIPDEAVRAGILASIAPGLSDAADDKLLTEIKRISNVTAKARLLGSMNAKPAQRPQVLFEIILLLEQRETRDAGVSALIQISQKEEESGKPYLVTELADRVLICRMEEWPDHDAFRVLMTIAPRLGAEGVVTAVQKLNSVLYLSSDQRNEVMISLIRRLAQLEEVSKAIELAKTNCTEEWYAAALSQIALFSAPSERELLRQHVVSLVSDKKWLAPESSNGSGLRKVLEFPEPGAEPMLILRDMSSAAMPYIMPQLDDEDLCSQGAWMILDHWFPKDGAWIIPQLANTLSDRQNRILFLIVLRVLSRTDGRESSLIHRQRALAQLAVSIPMDLISRTLKIGIDMIAEVEQSQGDLLRDMADEADDRKLEPDGKHTARDFVRFFSDSFDLEDIKDQIDAILAIAMRDPNRFVPEVAPILRKQHNEVARLYSLSALCPYLSESDFVSSVELARRIAEGFRNGQIGSDVPQLVSLALVQLASQASDSEKDGLYREAVLCATGIANPVERNDVLVRMIQLMPHHVRREVFTTELEDRQKISDELKQVALLVNLAVYLSADYQRAALPGLLSKVDRVYVRRSKNSIGGRLVQEDRERILSVLVPMCARNGYRMEILRLVDDFAMMSPDMLKRVMDDMRQIHVGGMSSATSGFEGNWSSAEETRFVPVDPGSDFPKTSNWINGFQQLLALSETIRHQPRQVAFERLNEFVVLLHEIGGNDLVDDIYEAVLAIGEWWP